MKLFCAALFLATAAYGAPHDAAYNRFCKSCHGADGTPNKAVEKMMKVQMRDLKHPEVQGMTDDQLRKIILEGVGKMKATRGISSKQADETIATMRSFKQ